MTKIHLIDDDLELHDLLKTYFEYSAIDLSVSETPSQGLEYLDHHAVELLILDLMLPEMDGFEVCKRVRQDHPLLPIIMLTAKGDDLNKILGLEMGADDYMSKPFNPRELEARIKTILRRIERVEKHKDAQSNSILSSEKWELELNLDAREVSFKGQKIEFTATEFDVLKALMEHQGMVQSRDALMNHTKGTDWESFDRSIDMYISKIRQKLEENPKKPEMIKTVWGIGYIFPKD